MRIIQQFIIIYPMLSSKVMTWANSPACIRFVANLTNKAIYDFVRGASARSWFHRNLVNYKLVLVVIIEQHWQLR